MPSYDKKIIIERYPNGLFSLWAMSDADDCMYEACGLSCINEVLKEVREQLEKKNDT